MVGSVRADELKQPRRIRVGAQTSLCNSLGRPVSSGMVLRVIIVMLLLIHGVHAQRAPGSMDDDRARYAPLLTAEAVRHNVPPALADAVATVESAYDWQAVGASGEVGLMQILPSTAEMLGFRGTLSQLADPATNIRLGVQYLAGAWQSTDGRLCDTLMKYRAGYGVEAVSSRSIIYCRRARDYLASIHSPLASGPGAEIPAIAVGRAPAIRRSHEASPALLTQAEFVRLRRGRRTVADSLRYWAAEEGRIKELRSRLALRRLARASGHFLRVSALDSR